MGKSCSDMDARPNDSPPPAVIPATIRKSPRVRLVAIPTYKSRFERDTESSKEMVQRMSTVSAPVPNQKDAVVFVIGSGEGGGTIGEAKRVKCMPMPGTQVLASLWRDLGIGPKPEPQVSTFISDKRVDESSEEEDEEVQGEADDEEAEEAEGEAGEAHEEEQGDEEEEDGDDEDEDEGDEDEDEDDGDEEEEEGDDFGHSEEEEQLQLVIYRITLEDEHYLTSLQIEDFANSNDLHEAVLDLIIEHGHLDHYDDIPLEDYSIFYLQELGDENFLRLDREELDWGFFREVVHRVAACDGGPVLDVYLRAEENQLVGWNGGNQLVGWKGIPLSTCGENVELLGEMVKDYFIQHADEDADAYTFVYYTKLEDRNEILDGEERELSLETDWEVFNHLLRGVVAVKDGDLEDYAWQDGDEMWIPWKPQEGEDRYLVGVCYRTPNGIRFYMPDLLIDSEVNSLRDFHDRLRAHYVWYHEDTILSDDAPANFEMYQFRYRTILEGGVEEDLDGQLPWDEIHNMLNLVILENADEG